MEGRVNVRSPIASGGYPARIAVVLALSVGAKLLAPQAALAETLVYYHLDPTGSVRAVTGNSGSLVEQHDYYAYGEECTDGVCTGNVGVNSAQPLHFTGKERDKETGLDYFGARYYGSRIGRFTTVDPIFGEETLADPQRWNRYSYALNNPFKYVDPDGRQVAEIALQAGRDAWAGPTPAMKAVGGTLLLVGGIAWAVENSDGRYVPSSGMPMTVLDYKVQTGAYTTKGKSDEEIRYEKFEEDRLRTQEQRAKEKDKFKGAPNGGDAAATEESIRKAQEAERKGGREKIGSTGKAQQRAEQSRPKSSDEKPDGEGGS